MRRFGLIGFPLGHSFSKRYFSEKFLRENISDCSYDNFPLPDISRLTDLIRENDLEGLNVTIPYKSSVMQFLDKIDPEALEVGAVNVIRIKKTGLIVSLSGFNSDITGIMDTLKPVTDREIASAIVLGTGGSSKAVCYVLKKLKISFKLVSREKKPDTLTYTDLDPGILRNSHLIINTTPLGMYPDTEGKPDIDYNLLRPAHILFDLVYNPEITSFLKMGQERGCTVLTGLRMLYSQADRSWEIWNSTEL